MTELWKLEEVPLRNIWKHEQYDFSAWLANHVNELWDEIWFSLTDIETEKFVWNYRCDILCKDEITDKTVLIENQFEETNHDHLWKLITYASWLDASIIIRVVEDAREEHRSAIERLNKHTDEDLTFFLVEIHAYKIGDSKPAPKFEIIEQPNEFAKIAKEWRTKNLTDTHAKRFEFWNELKDVVKRKWNPFNIHKSAPKSLTNISTWDSRTRIRIELSKTQHKITISYQIKDDKDLYDELYNQKEDIESKIWAKLKWNRMDNNKTSRIDISIDWLDFDKQDNYPELMDKCIDNVLLLKEAFKPYL